MRPLHKLEKSCQLIVRGSNYVGAQGNIMSHGHATLQAFQLHIQRLGSATCPQISKKINFWKIFFRGPLKKIFQKFDPLKHFLHLKMLNSAPKWHELMPEIPNVWFVWLFQKSWRIFNISHQFVSYISILFLTHRHSFSCVYRCSS
jgi:hypothetical protein